MTFPPGRDYRTAVLALCALLILNISGISYADPSEDSLGDPRFGSSTDTSQWDTRQASAAEITLDEEEMADTDQEEFSDWIMLMPGFYPLDQAGFAQPYRGLVMGLPPSAVSLHFRGREIQDHLLGVAEINWIPPEALSKLQYDPWPLDAPGGRIEADLRTMQPVPPSSRIATRDGYYGLGTVDFDLAQKITPDYLLVGGGRVATYGGRLYHSEGYGLNLRGEVVFRDSSDLWGWGGIMQSRLNSQVPFNNINHDREKYDADVILNWKEHSARLYGVQQRETYGSGDADSWDELGFVYTLYEDRDSFGGDIQLNAAAARWRLKTLDWSATSLGGAGATLWGDVGDWVKAESKVSLNLSDDFTPERRLGFRVESWITSFSAFFAGISQNQRTPSRFETSADFAPGEHYLIYDPVFFQYPDLSITGSPDLRNETYNTAFMGGRLKSDLVEGALGGAWYRVEDPISWHVENGIIKAYNGADEDFNGALGWIKTNPFPGILIGATGSHLPLKGRERRLFPETMGHAWMQYSWLMFQEHLDLRVHVWEDYWGQRWAPVPGGWEKMGDAFTLSARISARLLGVRLYWGVNNILARHYELLPGFPMMHKEEVWGISWNFRD